MFIIAKQVEKEAKDAMVKTVLKCHENLVQDPRNNNGIGTPRDTGFAANNWLVSLNKPGEGTPNAASSGTVESGIHVVFDWEFGDVVHVTNNVPYINRLNYGHSTQAPAGFIERAVENAITDTQIKARTV